MQPNINFTESKLRNGGVRIRAHHPRRNMVLTVTPAPEDWSTPGFLVHDWSITHTFRERDADGEPLWEMPEIHQCLHGGHCPTLEDGIAYAKRIAEGEVRQALSVGGQIFEPAA